tara:strand:- start:116 stop:628 length:513 start_codon:yes stop_codon:yes gene_type:complete
MSVEIVNKVERSGIITLDLSNYAPKKIIEELDLRQFLFEGLILKEKQFRADIKDYNFEKYKGKTVALFCSSDVIIPMWAYMLITAELDPICSKLYFGRALDVSQQIILENIRLIEEDKYSEKRVIVKGCSNIPLNESLYIEITKKLLNSVQSLMFGEACSAVPVYKTKVK